MKKDCSKSFILSGCLFLIFALFTIMVKTVDVQYVGENTVGFSFFNEMCLISISNAVGYGGFWYELSEILGYCAIGVALGFALFAGWQLIKGKSLRKVDPCLIALGVYYAIVIAFYAFFEKVIINYRPVLEDGEYEASYPSSHTVLAVCIFSTAILIFKRYFNDKIYKIAATVSIILMVLTVVARLLSGVHWVTDIIGGLLLSAALVSLYAGMYRKVY